MRPRRSRTLTVDALEDRLVMTAFTLPFSPVKLPAGEVNPKFLNLTGRTQSQISSAITNSFDRFSREYLAADAAYKKGLAGPTPGDPVLLLSFAAQVATAFNQLSGSMLDVSHKLPYGGVNLNPLLQSRTVAPNIINVFDTHYTPSLKTGLEILGGTASTTAIRLKIQETQSLVRTDVNDYINLGVTNHDFRLTRGASLPTLS